MHNHLDLQLAAAQAAGLTSITHLRCLIYIATRDDATASRMADHVRLSSAAMTGVLDSFDQAGLVTRTHPTRGQGDRRKVHLDLTPEGRSTVAEIMQAIVAGV